MSLAKIYEKPYLKKQLKEAQEVPLPFAFGAGDGPDSHVLVLHPTKLGKALFGLLKKERGFAKGTWGVARMEDKVLVLDCEKKLSGAAKLAKQYLKANKPLPFTKTRVMFEGAELDDDDQPIVKDEIDQKLDALDELKKITGALQKVSPQAARAKQLRPDKSQQIDELFRKTLDAVKAKDGESALQAFHAYNNLVVDILEAGDERPTGKVSQGQREALDDSLRELLPLAQQARRLEGADTTRLIKLLSAIAKTWGDGAEKTEDNYFKAVKLVDGLRGEVEKLLDAPDRASDQQSDEQRYQQLLNELESERRIQAYDDGSFAPRLKQIKTLGSGGNFKAALQEMTGYERDMRAYIRTAEDVQKALQFGLKKLFDRANAVPQNNVTRRYRDDWLEAKRRLDDYASDNQYGRAASQLEVAVREAKALTALASRIEGQTALLANSSRLMPAPDTLGLGKNQRQAISKATDRGGTKGHGKYFKAVLKALEKIDSKPEAKSFDALEKTARGYIDFFEQRQAKLEAKGGKKAERAKDKESDAISRKKLEVCQDALKRVTQFRAHAKYGEQMQRLTADLPAPPELWPEEKVKQLRELQMQVLTEFPTELGSQSAAPPPGKGDSDSFFINGPDGKPMFIYKTKQGENVKPGEKEGMGVTRELLSSKLNGQMAEMTGLDFGFANATFARLDCEGFDHEDCSSQATSRVGVLLEGIEHHSNLEDMLGGDKDDLARIPDQDVQKIALLDFITLQGDRNAENVLIQTDSEGRERLRPIDGGFAFPSPTLFEEYRFGMPGSSLMRLPAADKPFTPEVRGAIDQLDPDRMVEQMKQANKDLPAELRGLVEDDSFEMMRRSILFLKAASRQLTPREIATLYETEFPKLLKVGDGQVDRAVAAAVQRGLAFRQFDQSMQPRREEYERLGGRDKLRELGWDSTDKLLTTDLERCLDILRNDRANPNPVPATDSTILSTEEKQQAYERMGGDAALRRALERPDTKLPVKNFDAATVPVKYGLLDHVTSYQNLGGDRRYDDMVENWDTNRYQLFEDLDAYGKLCRAAFSECRFSPYNEDIMSKRQILEFYDANK